MVSGYPSAPQPLNLVPRSHPTLSPSLEGELSSEQFFLLSSHTMVFRPPKGAAIENLLKMQIGSGVRQVIVISVLVAALGWGLSMSPGSLCST